MRKNFILILALSTTGLLSGARAWAGAKPSDRFQKPAWWDSVPAPTLKKAETWEQTIRVSFPENYREIEKFYYIGPFDNEKGEGFNQVFPPEQGVDFKATYPGAGGELAKWQEAPAAWKQAFTYHDLNVFKKKEWAVAYALGYFDSVKAEKWLAYAGSDDTITIWLNGVKVLANETYRGATPDSDKVLLNVKPGRNELLLKICQGTGGWGFYFDLRNPVAISVRARAKRLAALMDLFPEDHNNAYEAKLEIADIMRAEGSGGLSQALHQTLRQGYPCAETSITRAANSFLAPGYRLALLGDSITEQRRYTRIIETYLTTACPQLHVDVRQFGWSGEQLDGLLKRLDSDVLRFKPDAATFFYGMNDFQYKAFDQTVADHFADNVKTLLKRLKKAGVKAIAASPGAVSLQPPWAWIKVIGPELMNDSLYRFGKMEEAVAKEEGAGFFSNFLPMICAENSAQALYGRTFRWAPDGVHPDWAGHLLMASNFLGAFGLDGEIGRFEVDLKKGSATASEGHQVLSFAKGVLTLQSSRLPFYLGEGELKSPDSMAAAEPWTDFQNRFNRFMLVVRDAPEGSTKITWGSASRVYSASQLKKGVNLAKDFPLNPLILQFQRVDQLVAMKQELETYEIKQVAHGPAGAKNLDNALAVCEGYRSQLISNIWSEMQPVTHKLEIRSLKK